MVMSSQSSFDALMARLRGGDKEAAAQVFNHFADQLLALARGRLTEGVRRKLDPEDVLQSVFRSFFTRHRQGHFEIENWDSLWGILTVITLRKCGRQIEHFHAACRDVQREVPVQPDEATTAWQTFAREPTPSEAAVLTDLVEHLMRGLEERDRQILVLHLQGHTLTEIGEQVGRAERTVRRTIEQVRKRLRRLQEAEVGPG
jgi:RNA polymerase sigma-70 factor (ECF subfamily)